jgi:hypothetical protein
MKGSGLGSELIKVGIPATINPRYVGSVAKSHYLGADVVNHFWAYSRQAPPSPACRSSHCRSSHLRLLTHYTQPSHALTDFSDAFQRARKYRVVIAIVMVIMMIFHADPLCGFFAPYIDAASGPLSSPPPPSSEGMFAGGLS